MNNQAQKLMDAARMDAHRAAVLDAIEEVQRNAELEAKLRRVFYEASLAEGFTHTEALDLCIVSAAEMYGE